MSQPGEGGTPKRRRVEANSEQQEDAFLVKDNGIHTQADDPDYIPNDSASDSESESEAEDRFLDEEAEESEFASGEETEDDSDYSVYTDSEDEDTGG